MYICILIKTIYNLIMKGLLKKDNEGYWKVLYTVPHPKIMVKQFNMSLPLHPKNVIDVEQHIEATKITHNLPPNMEVEFDWCVIVDHNSGKGIEYAKLLKSYNN